MTHLLWSPSELPLGVFTETALLYPPPGGKLALSLFSRSLALALVLGGGGRKPNTPGNVPRGTQDQGVSSIAAVDKLQPQCRCSRNNWNIPLVCVCTATW